MARQLSTASVLAALVMLGGCEWVTQKAKDAVKDTGASAQETAKQHCDARLPGETGKVPNPVIPTSCFPPVMICHYCEYADGEFVGSGFDPCGVCVIEEAP